MKKKVYINKLNQQLEERTKELSVTKGKLKLYKRFVIISLYLVCQYNFDSLESLIKQITKYLIF